MKQSTYILKKPDSIIARRFSGRPPRKAGETVDGHVIDALLGWNQTTDFYVSDGQVFKEEDGRFTPLGKAGAARSFFGLENQSLETAVRLIEALLKKVIAEKKTFATLNDHDIYLKDEEICFLDSEDHDPDFFDPAGEITPASDVFSIGVLFRELLMPRMVFEVSCRLTRQSPQVEAHRTVRDIHCEEDVDEQEKQQWLSVLNRILIKATAPQTKDRYADAEEMLAETEEFRQLLNRKPMVFQNPRPLSGQHHSPYYTLTRENRTIVVFNAAQDTADMLWDSIDVDERAMYLTYNGSNWHQTLASLKRKKLFEGKTGRDAYLDSIDAMKVYDLVVVSGPLDADALLSSSLQEILAAIEARVIFVMEGRPDEAVFRLLSPERESVLVVGDEEPFALCRSEITDRIRTADLSLLQNIRKLKRFGRELNEEEQEKEMVRRMKGEGLETWSLLYMAHRMLRRKTLAVPEVLKYADHLFLTGRMQEWHAFTEHLYEEIIRNGNE